MSGEGDPNQFIIGRKDKISTIAREIRLQILEYVIPQEIYFSNVFDRGKSTRKIPRTGLMRVSRLFHEEASAIFYKRVTFHLHTDFLSSITDLETIPKWIPIQPLYLQNIRLIDLVVKFTLSRPMDVLLRTFAQTSLVSSTAILNLHLNFRSYERLALRTLTGFPIRNIEIEETQEIGVIKDILTLNPGFNINLVIYDIHALGLSDNSGAKWLYDATGFSENESLRVWDDPAAFEEYKETWKWLEGQKN